MKELLREWEQFEQETLLTEISKDQVLDSISPNNKKFIKLLYQQSIRVVGEEATQKVFEQENFLQNASDKYRGILSRTIPTDLTDSQMGAAANWIKKMFLTTPYGDKVIKNIFKRPNFEPGRMSVPVRLKSSVENFFKVQNFIDTSEFSKDINTYKSDLDLEIAVEDAMPRYREHLEKKKYLDAESGMKLIADVGEWKIYIPTNKGAACELGKGTAWCTAAPGLDYYEKYHKEDDPLIVFVNKDHPHERYQLHYGTDQFMDTRDRQIDVTLVLKFHNILLQNAPEHLPESAKDKFVKNLDGSISVKEEFRGSRVDGVEWSNIEAISSIPLIHRTEGPARIEWLPGHNNIFQRMHWAYQGRVLGTVEYDEKFGVPSIVLNNLVPPKEFDNEKIYIVDPIKMNEWDKAKERFPRIQEFENKMLEDLAKIAKNNTKQVDEQIRNKRLVIEIKR